MRGWQKYEESATYTLEAVSSLSLLANDVEDGIDELGSLGVVLSTQEGISREFYILSSCTDTLGPVVSSSRLAKDEVVGTWESANRFSSAYLSSS